MNNNNEKDLMQQVLSNYSSLDEDEFLKLFLGTGDIKNFVNQGVNRLMNKFLIKDRDIYLNANNNVSGNGFAPSRKVNLGTFPVNIRRPRTRDDDFYPEILEKYQRNIPEDYSNLLTSILLGAKNFKSVHYTLKSLGLSYSVNEVNEIIEELYEEAKEFNLRPLHPDWLFLFADGKEVYLKDENRRIKKGCHFLVAGISMEARKEILINKVFYKHESKEVWREVLIELKNRGLTRVLMIVTDDYPGVTNLVKSLFPQTDHQLCMVHLLRNAYKHLSPSDYTLFKEKLDDINKLCTYEDSLKEFKNLCDSLAKKNKGFIDNVSKKSENFMSYLKYPSDLQGHIKTTNFVEGMNNNIETIKRNSGGHFHTDRELMVKMNIMITRLYKTKWKNPSPMFKSFLSQLNAMFYKRFEDELGDDFFLR